MVLMDLENLKSSLNNMNSLVMLGPGAIQVYCRVNYLQLVLAQILLTAFS